MDKISSVVADELTHTANAAKGTDISTEELKKKLEDTTHNAFKQLKAEVIELTHLQSNSTEQVANKMAEKINHNKALQSALPSDGKISPRSVAQMVITCYGAIMQAVDK